MGKKEVPTKENLTNKVLGRTKGGNGVCISCQFHPEGRKKGTHQTDKEKVEKIIH